MTNFIGPQDQSIGINIANSVQAETYYSPFRYAGKDIHESSMVGYSIEQHLHSFSGEYPYNFLWSNWVIEKEAFQKRLASISLTFTSYSSHGVDHSKAILSRIEALLGEDRIKRLSPTDAWLLLQCAYSHDIGMCVGEDEKAWLLREIEENPNVLKELFSDRDFKHYLTAADASPFYSPFRAYDRFVSSVRFLNQMIDRNDQEEMEKFLKQIKSGEYSQAKNIYTTVITRYFRFRHAQRTREMLIHEAQDATMNGILPIRLRKIVAEIDYCHGTAWREILVRLPKQDNGLHTDYIHPQFIAALLRLGDLLDLDSNRFNPYQIENNGILSRDSVIHILKHMAVTKFMVDKHWIDIEARYRYNEVYDFLVKKYFPRPDNKKIQEEYPTDKKLNEKWRHLETQKIIEESSSILRDWISWLHDDLKEFSHSWNAIVPDNMSGYIAALRKNDIYIGDSDEPVEKDELELRYFISPRRASQIIEGSELYSDSLVFIRELVQNSIDATKRQIYKTVTTQLDNPNGEKEIAFQQIVNDSLLVPILKKYKVNVLIEYIQGPSNEKELPDKLKITFRDYGIGITYEKLKQMRHIGAVSLSEEERSELKKTPEWLKPTGEYGIGMQSVFTVVDSFYIETYPRYENNRIANRKRFIRLFCPELGGDIVNEEMQKAANEKSRFGTDVIIQLPLNRENIRKFMRSKQLDIFDVRGEKVLDIGAVVVRLQQYILETFTDDVVSLEFDFQFPSEKTKEQEKETRHLASFSFPNYLNQVCAVDGNYLFIKETASSKQDFTFCYWYNSADNKESVLLTLHNEAESRVRLYYKGIVISNNESRYNPSRIFSIPGVDMQINIMSGRAGELLEISRDYIKPAGYTLLRSIIQHALVSFYKTVYLCLNEADYKKKDKNQSEGVPDFHSSMKKDLYTFFLQNPAHMICFYQILVAFKEQIDVSNADNIADQLEDGVKKIPFKSSPVLRTAEPIMVPTMSILNGKMYISSMASHEAIRWIKAGNIWFTDFRFDDSFCVNIELKHRGNDIICAMHDNLSGIYDLTYGKVRIIQDIFWTTEYVKLYTLIKADTAAQYPEFIIEEYYKLCLLIVNEYINRYQTEKNADRKEEIGNYILSFPAVKKYQKIAVDRFPTESPDELAGRFTRFIICPCNVEKLSKFFSRLETQQPNIKSELAFLSNENLEALFNDQEIQQFIQKLPLIQKETSLNNRIKQYKALFLSFGMKKKNGENND